MSAPLAIVCPHRPPCPGCPRFLAGLDPQHPELAPLVQLAEQAGIVLELAEPGAAVGYRHRARLAVRGRAGAPELGIFEEGTHRAVDIPDCVVHHPRVNEVAAVFRQALRELRVEPYADAQHRGLARYLQIVIERGSGAAQVVLVHNGGTPGELSRLIARVRALLGARLHSLFVSEQSARSNAILGPSCEPVCGPPAVCEQIAGARVFFPPDAFGQSNLPLYAAIVERIGTLVGDGADVLEAYAGTGAIGLSVLPRVRRVRFNEVGGGSLAGLQLGLDALPDAVRARGEVHAGPIAQHAGLVEHADVVIADPPRKGLDPAFIAALLAHPPARFVYLSCGLPALLRDAGAMLAAGSLRLSALTVYDLFPFTAHVETLAVFDREEEP